MEFRAWDIIPVIGIIQVLSSPDAGTGRQAGLRSQCQKWRGSSNLPWGTPMVVSQIIECSSAMPNKYFVDFLRGSFDGV